MKRIIILVLSIVTIGVDVLPAQFSSIQVSYMPFQYWMYNKTDLNYVELYVPGYVDYQVGNDAAPNGQMVSIYLPFKLNDWLSINTGLSWSTQYQTYRSLSYANYSIPFIKEFRAVSSNNSHKSKVNYLHLPVGVQVSWNDDYWLSPVLEAGVQVSYMQDYVETREFLVRTLPYDGSFYTYGTTTYLKRGNKVIYRDKTGSVILERTRSSHIYNLWAFGAYFRGGLRKYLGEQYFIEMLLRSDYDFTNTDHVENNTSLGDLYHQGYKGLGLSSSSAEPRTTTHNIRLGIELSFGVLF